MFTNLASLVGQCMPLISFSVSSKPMALNKEQASLVTKGKNVRTYVASEESVGITPRSKEKTMAMLQESRKKREPVISLALVGAPKHASATCEKTSQSDERRSSASKNSDAYSSTWSYHGSPTSNHHWETSLSCCDSSFIQVMALIKPQVAPVHADKNKTSFTMKRHLAGIVSRAKMNTTRHTTPVAIPPKSHEGCGENQPAIHFVS